MLLALAAAALAGTAPLAAIVRASAADCPPPREGEINVCGRRDETRRYLPPLPDEHEAGTLAARTMRRERYDLLDYDAGGANSCSSVGPGGMYGCAFKTFKAGVAQRNGARDPRGPLFDR